MYFEGVKSSFIEKLCVGVGKTSSKWVVKWRNLCETVNKTATFIFMLLSCCRTHFFAMFESFMLSGSIFYALLNISSSFIADSSLTKLFLVLTNLFFFFVLFSLQEIISKFCPPSIMFRDATFHTILQIFQLLSKKFHKQISNFFRFSGNSFDFQEISFDFYELSFNFHDFFNKSLNFKARLLRFQYFPMSFNKFMSQ